jgi:DMSO reductase anchor subunit
VTGDRSLVGFTVLAQAAVGSSWGLAAAFVLVAHRAGLEVAGAATAWGVVAVPALSAFAVAVSLLHLGRPDRALRAVANLRRSWLSREVLAAALFTATAAALLLLPGPWRGPLLAGTAVLGVLLLVAMVRTYRLRTVPAWDSWATGAMFLQSALATGGALTALALALRSPHGHAGAAQTGAAVVGALALVAGPLLAARWRAALSRSGGAGEEAARRLAAGAFLRRGRLAAALAGAALLLAALALTAPWRGAGLAGALLLALLAEALGRALFYRARVRSGL